jgi:hypothetical protein
MHLKWFCTTRFDQLWPSRTTGPADVAFEVEGQGKAE